MKTIPVSFRIPFDTHKKLSEKAKDANMSLTDFFKAAIVSNQSIVVAKEPKKTKNEQKIIRISAQISNNLNQLTHRINTDNLAGVLSDDRYKNLNYELLKIRLELARITEE